MPAREAQRGPAPDGAGAVVLGARAYADGRPSDALADRVRTACRLHRAGYAPRLVLSGGPGDGAVHETEAMRALALAEGVPADAIVIDPQGLSTRATARNAAALLPGARVLAVSHAFHLPRVDLAFERAGLETYTVPAEENSTLRSLPRLLARETTAWWWYVVSA